MKQKDLEGCEGSELWEREGIKPPSSSSVTVFCDSTCSTEKTLIPKSIKTKNRDDQRSLSRAVNDYETLK